MRLKNIFFCFLNGQKHVNQFFQYFSTETQSSFVRTNFAPINGAYWNSWCTTSQSQIKRLVKCNITWSVWISNELRNQSWVGIIDAYMHSISTNFKSQLPLTASNYPNTTAMSLMDLAQISKFIGKWEFHQLRHLNHVFIISSSRRQETNFNITTICYITSNMIHILKTHVHICISKSDVAV